MKAIISDELSAVGAFLFVKPSTLLYYACTVVAW